VRLAGAILTLCVAMLQAGVGAAAPAKDEGPTSIESGPCGIWVAAGGGTVVRLDPRSGRPVGRAVRVGYYPVDLACLDHSLWVANHGGGGDRYAPPGGSLTRIDARTGRVTATVRVPGWHVLRVAAGARRVWAAAAFGSGRGRIVAVDARSARIVRSVRLQGGVAPIDVAVAAGRVWAATRGTVVPIDPHSGRVGSARATGSPIRLVAAFGSVWVADGAERTLVRLDARSGRVLARVPLRGWPWQLAVGGGAVWAGLFDRRAVVRVDPATNRVAGPPLVVPGRERRIDALAISGGTIWVANSYGRVFRLDARGRQVGRAVVVP
jgi:DNA-binding beta-propeller fold protein YncE